VRKTERRLPKGFQATDLGEAVVASDGRCALISFITAPVIVGRANTYVVIVSDAALAANVATFEWTFKENNAVKRTGTTVRADAFYQPTQPGSLSVSVRLLDSSNAQQANLTLDQPISAPSATLESLIQVANDAPGPGIGNPETLRELVNEHSVYYQGAALKTPEAGTGFHRLLFGMASEGASRHTIAERRVQVELLASTIEDGAGDYARLAATGVGVCDIRLALLAMTMSPPLLPWKELPDAADQRAFADEQLRAQLAALSEEARIDLFNIARFPKSNILACARVLEALRDRYFAGTSFDDVLTGLSGTRAHWIIRHLREGPLLHT